MFSTEPSNLHEFIVEYYTIECIDLHDLIPHFVIIDGHHNETTLQNRPWRALRIFVLSIFSDEIPDTLNNFHLVLKISCLNQLNLYQGDTQAIIGVDSIRFGDSLEIRFSWVVVVPFLLLFPW